MQRRTFLGTLATAAALGGATRGRADTLEIKIGAATSVDHAPVFAGSSAASSRRTASTPRSSCIKAAWR